MTEPHTHKPVVTLAYDIALRLLKHIEEGGQEAALDVIKALGISTAMVVKIFDAKDTDRALQLFREFFDAEFHDHDDDNPTEGEAADDHHI